MALLPPVIATLIADGRQYNAEMDKAIGKMRAFGDSGTATGKKIEAFANKASTASSSKTVVWVSTVSFMAQNEKSLKTSGISACMACASWAS